MFNCHVLLAWALLLFMPLPLLAIIFVSNHMVFGVVLRLSAHINVGTDGPRGAFNVSVAKIRVCYSVWVFSQLNSGAKKKEKSRADKTRNCNRFWLLLYIHVHVCRCSWCAHSFIMRLMDHNYFYIVSMANINPRLQDIAFVRRINYNWNENDGTGIIALLRLSSLPSFPCRPG